MTKFFILKNKKGGKLLGDSPKLYNDETVKQAFASKFHDPDHYEKIIVVFSDAPGETELGCVIINADNNHYVCGHPRKSAVESLTLAPRLYKHQRGALTAIARYQTPERTYQVQWLISAHKKLPGAK